MEDFFNARKAMRNSRSSLQEHRRPLKTPLLTQTGLNTEFDCLQDKQDHFVEFENKYLGDIPGVPLDVDTSNRTEVLKIIDRGKKQGLIPHLSYDHDAILYLSKIVIRIIKRDTQEEVLVNLPLHEVAQMCYVKEDGLHILTIKHGTPERLSLAVMYVVNQETAEGICSLVSHCFHLVNTDAMIDLIEDTIDKAIPPYLDADGNSNTSNSTPGTHMNYTGSGFISPSVHNIPRAVQDSPGRPQRAQSTISNESSQADLLRDYMWQLHTKVKPEELKTFSQLLKSWNYNSNKLQEFCDNVYKLYGPQRKYLLTGLFPFIPERDSQAFENFLKSHDINLPGTGTLNSFHGYPPAIYTRSISDISINSTSVNSNDLDLTANGHALDNELEAMGKKMENIELSVGEPTQSYLHPSFDKNSKI